MASRRKQRKRPARNLSPGGGFALFIITRVACALVVAGLLVVMYLDQEIRRRFDGDVQSRPAHVYARPPVLSPGTAISMDELTAALRQRGYTRVSRLAAPGQYSTGPGGLDLYTREFATAAGRLAPVAARVKFGDGRIQSILGHQDGRALERLRLEPLRVGSLRFGAHQDRIALKLHEMPESLVRTLLAMEDRRFESHHGVDPRGLARALWSNLRQGRTVQGGSTLTQQLVKNLFLTPQRSLTRKSTELLMALIMELRFSKGEILELYLNEIFLGQSGNRAVHGFALAAGFYFGKPLDQLTLDEIALLVGIIPAPSYYNPRRHPERALGRRNLVLNTLAGMGDISPGDAERLSARPLGMVERRVSDNEIFPTYLDYLYRQLRQYYTEDVLTGSGLRLYTSLDARIQRRAQDALSETLSRLEGERNMPAGELQGAVVVVDPRNGDILALVGDRVRGFSGFNRAIDAERPIGSLVKPAVYLTALEKPRRYTLATRLEDRPLTLTPEGGEAWSPRNYDREFRGEVALYEALVQSYNVPTVRLGLEVGVDSVIDTLRRLGLEGDIPEYPATLLGAGQHSPLEMAQVYQVLANTGRRIPLRAIRAIHNDRGEVVARARHGEHQAVDAGSAYLVDYLLRMVVSEGTASGLRHGFGAEPGFAGKTGTTDDFRDSWFAGYGDDLLAVVWVGRDDNQPVRLSGSSGAMRVWARLMAGLDPQPRAAPPPDSVVMVDIDPGSGLVANYKCPQRRPLAFVRGSQPEAFAPCSGITARLGNWLRSGAGGTVAEPGGGRP